ncbi:unnamed protein product, partial [Rotaria sordida]
ENRDRRQNISAESQTIRTRLISIENQIDDDEGDQPVDQPPKKKTKRSFDSTQSKYNYNKDNEDHGSYTPEQIQQSPINNSRRSKESRVQDTQPSLRVPVDDNTASNANNYSKSSNNHTDIYELIRKDINDVYVKLDNSLNVHMIKFERRLTKLTNICSAGVSIVYDTDTRF